MTEIALLLTSALFGVYSWLSGLELGVGLLRLTRDGQAQATKNRTLFTPLWEITNVFLVFGFTAFFVFFNNALPELSTAVFSTVVIGMTALLVRACLVLYIYYHRNRLGWNLSNLLFVVCSLVVPLSVAAVGIYAVTGRPFWLTSSGRLFGTVALLGLLALAASFTQFVHTTVGKLTNRRRLFTTGLTVIWAALGTLGLQHITSSSHLFGNWFVVWTALLDLTLLYTAILLFIHKEQWLWWGLSIASIVTPGIWAMANRPYLVFPGLIETAYGAQAYDKAALVGLGLIFPVVALGLGLFVKLFTTQKDSQ